MYHSDCTISTHLLALTQCANLYLYFQKKESSYSIDPLAGRLPRLVPAPKSILLQSSTSCGNSAVHVEPEEAFRSLHCAGLPLFLQLCAVAKQHYVLSAQARGWC